MPRYSFTLNGQPVEVDAPGDLSVLWTLRDRLGVTGPKYGCGINVCKACTSHLDGQAFNPCVVNLRDVQGREVTTIEGLADGERLHPVQQAWLDQDVAQCGFCQPGQIMAAVALLARTDQPSDADIEQIENVCRCGTYFRIRQAIKSAALALREQQAAGGGGAGAAAAAPGAGAAAAAPGGTGAAAAAAGGSPAVAARTLPATGPAAATAAMAAALVAAAAAARAATADDDADRG